MELSKNAERETSNELTSSPEDSLVRISPLRESEPELKALARVFGLSSPVLLGRLDPSTSSLRTYQGSLFTEQCEEAEITRVLAKSLAHFRKRNAEKTESGF